MGYELYMGVGALTHGVQTGLNAWNHVICARIMV